MGIVQGSCLGTTLYIVMVSDLKLLSVINILFKFADDTTFLVPENTDIDQKAFRWGYSCDLKRLSFLLHKTDKHLLHKMVYNKDHCMGLVTLNHPTFNHATANHRHIISWTVNNASYNHPTVKHVDILLLDS